MTAFDSGAERFLEIKNLTVAFGSAEVVRGLDLSLARGEVLGLVGESGSGKSISALSIMGLLPRGAAVREGEISLARYRGGNTGELQRQANSFGREISVASHDLERQNILALGPKERRELCGRRMGLVFQEPLTALNPVLTIGEQVAEIFRLRAGQSRGQAKESSLQLLGRVGLSNPAEAFRGYPHRFSGGMRQRVVAAMAMALSPELLIADEPTTALDPTIAAQILDLLKDLTAERRTAVIFITHNLRLLNGLARRLMVMYAGLILEHAPTAEIFSRPAHPYTQGLLDALPPPLDQEPPRRLKAIVGSPPVPGEFPPGCPFAPRCPKKFEPCDKTRPPLTDLGQGRQVRCFLYGAPC